MASQRARDEHVDSWCTHAAVLFVDEPKATQVERIALGTA